MTYLYLACASLFGILMLACTVAVLKDLYEDERAEAALDLIDDADDDGDSAA